MELKLEEIVFRSWFYFRQGYTTYLTFIFSFFTFVSTTYYLAIENIPFFKDIFPRFYVYIVIAIVTFVPLSVIAGWLHMKGTLAYPAAQAITIESNPYIYKIRPGKETEINFPTYQLLLRIIGKITKKEDILSTEEKSELEEVLDKIEKLRKGEVVGVPRQRTLLAATKRKTS